MALTPADASTICELLRQHGITITCHITDGVAWIIPLAPLTTRQEVRVLRAFALVTDHYEWHPTGDKAVAA